MSDLLTNPAPSADDDIAPVGENDAAEGGEVGSGSSQIPEGYIPAERFNGLMSSFNKLQNESKAKDSALEELQDRLSALEAQLTKPNEEETPNVSTEDPRLDALMERVEQLTNLVVPVVESQTAQAQNQWRQELFNEFPQAKPFEDLFQADTPEELREVLEDFSNRFESISPTTKQDDSTSTTEDQEVPAVTDTADSGGGGVAVDLIDLAPTDEIRQALERRDVNGYLKAKARQIYGDEDGLVLTPMS